MKNTHSSRTAEGMAVIRAIESQKPENIRICYDPLSRKMLNGFSFTLSKWIINSGLYERMAPGVMSFLITRERYIDDYLIKSLADGIDQVVILGAGFDTRPYRLPGIEKTKVFEIDHPTTQEVKIKRLEKVLDFLPTNVSFISIDFNNQTLDECLLKGNSNYDEHGRTLFIWQGVTQYLTPEGIDNTLAFIVQHSGAHSSVIFDYFYNETLRDTSRPEVKLMYKATKKINENILFGIDKGQISSFLTQRGFQEIYNVTSEDLKQIYFTGPNSERAIASGCDIVSAKIIKKL